MSTLPLSILGMLDGLGFRTAPASAAADKEGFQSLLDISVGPENQESYDAPVRKEKHQDHNNDVAAALSDTPPVTDYAKPSPKEKEIISIVPARDDESHYSDKKTTETDAKPQVSDSAHPHEQHDDTAKVASDDVPSVAADDEPDTERLAGQLRGYMAFLRELLTHLQALGQAGNINGDTQLISVTKVTTAAFVFISQQDTANLSTPSSPADALENLQALFAKLRAMLSEDGELTAGQGERLRSFFAEIRQSTQTLWVAFKQQPGDAATLTDEVQALARQMADAYQSLSGMAKTLAAKQNASGADVQDTLDATLAVPAPAKDVSTALPKSALPAVPVLTDQAAPTINLTPVTNTQQSALAAAIVHGAAAQNAASDSGGSQNGGQSLPQALAIARDAGQQLSSQAAGAPDFAKLIAQAKTPVMEQVMLHIKTGMADGSSKIHITLEPAELGKLEIKLNVDANGKTGVTVTADNKQTLDLLQRDARGLERALADAGLKADSGSLNFNLRGDGQEHGQNPSHAAQTYLKIMPEEAEDAHAAAARSYTLNVAEGLDIRI